MSENNLMSIHANMHQHAGYWTVRVYAEKVDTKGFGEMAVNIRNSAQMAQVDSEIDQVWVALVVLLHLVEANGAVGRISHADWPPLF